MTMEDRYKLAREIALALNLKPNNYMKGPRVDGSVLGVIVHVLKENDDTR